MDNLKTKEKLRNSGSGDMNQLTPLPSISQKPRSPAEETARDQAVSGYKPRPNRVLIKCLPKILKTVPLPPTGTVKLLPHPPPKPPQQPRSPAEETARDQAVSGYKPRPNRVLIKSKCLPKILKTVPLPHTGTVKLLPHPLPKLPQHPAPRCRRLVIGSTENCVALRAVGTKF
ncbi:hypothetical protein OYC64_010291 [Pagothenia borchgrevinki]|uniref:Uncharacterized protein n=1 Tax=Pagothenia borchgrevinki TaxID=8213 RepID=A0ABD2GX37_PAGBO